MKNTSNQNNLLLWISLSMSIHAALLAWCPAPNFFTPPYPVYLVVDLFSGPANSGPGNGIGNETGGGKKPSFSKTLPTKEPLKPVSHIKRNQLPKTPTVKAKPTRPKVTSPKVKPIKIPATTGTITITDKRPVEVDAQHLNDPYENSDNGSGSSTTKNTHGYSATEGATGFGSGTGTGSGTGAGSGKGDNPGSGSPIETPMAYGSNPPPPYPSTARRRGWEGEVLLLVHVTSGGQVCKVEVNSSSGYRILDSAAVNAVYRWRFQVARLNGRAVAGQVLVPIRFDLRNLE